jgi:hypothetical protein
VIVTQKISEGVVKRLNVSRVLIVCDSHALRVRLYIPDLATSRIHYREYGFG